MRFRDWLPFSKKETVVEIMPPVKELVPAEKKGWASDLGPYVAFMTGEGIYAFHALSPYEIIRNYETIAPLAGAIDRLAQAVGSLPLALINTEDDQRIKSHPILDLLRWPNADYQKTRRDLVRDMVLWKVLEGDVFLIMSGPNVNSQPRELYLLNPQNVNIVADSRTGYASEYQYTGSGGQSEIYKRDLLSDRFFNAARTQELYHISNFNVRNSPDTLDGASEVSQLYYEINQYVFASQHNLSLMSNGMRPCGAFVLKTKSGEPAMLTQEQFDRLKAQINEQYTGAGNAGRPLVLEGGLEWQEMGITPKDMDFPKLKEQAENQIYKRLGVPVQLVSGDAVTSNNMQNIRREFYQSRVLPLGDDLMDHFNRALKPRYRDTARKELQIDRENIDILTEERAARREIIEKSLVMTVNEKRQYFNMPPIKGGNKIVDPNGRPIAGEDVPEDLWVTAKPNGGPKPAEPKPAEGA